MNKKLLCAALVALAALAIPAVASADTDPFQWDAYKQTGNVRDHRYLNANSPLTIRSLTVGLTIGGDDRNTLVKLGPNSEWQLVRANRRDHRSVKAGELVALYNKGGDGYLNAEGETAGRATARFMREPQYIWTVERKAGNRIAISTKGTGTERKYLVASTKNGKPELNWYRTGTPAPDTPGCSSGFPSGSLHREQVNATALPAVNMYPNYKATLGAGKCGDLTQIINQSNQVIGVLKPGHTAAECNDPNAVVYAGQYDSIGAVGAGFDSSSTRLLPVQVSICGYGNPGAYLPVVYEYYAR